MPAPVSLSVRSLRQPNLFRCRRGSLIQRWSKYSHQDPACLDELVLLHPSDRRDRVDLIRPGPTAGIEDVVEPVAIGAWVRERNHGSATSVSIVYVTRHLISEGSKGSVNWANRA